jgi:hypothetical protein
LDRRWQATTVEKCGGGDGFNPFGAHRVGIHRATASPVNERRRPRQEAFLVIARAPTPAFEWLITHEARWHQCAERQPNRPG